MHVRQRFQQGMWVLALLGLLLSRPHALLHAQEDPQQTIERLALEVYLQNLRAGNYMDWVGGKLGDTSVWNEPTAVGMNLADQTLSGFLGDEDFTFSALQRPLLVNLWASWCGPCRLEMPYLVQVATAPNAHHFDVLFVNTWDDPESAQEELANYPETIFTVRDEENRFSEHVRLVGLPSSLLVDVDGTVLAVYIGPLTRTAVDLLDAIAAHPNLGSFDAADYPDLEPAPALAPVSLEEATPIAYGETVRGTITDSAYQAAYRFRGQRGDVVHIEMHAVGEAEGAFGLDTSLFLMNAEGEILEANDDAPGMGTDSALTFTLPADGDYIIVATRFLERDGFESGAYTLSLERDKKDARAPSDTPLLARTHPATTPSAAPQQGGEPAPIAYGETVSGEINDAHHEQRWVFQGEQGDVVTIVMARAGDESGALDGYLLLLGPQGNTLIEVDDANQSVMPTITRYTLPEDGPYTIVATRFGFADGFSSGAYTLTLTREGSVGEAAAGGTRWFYEQRPPVRWLAYGQSASGTLADAHVEDWYVFQGTAGDVITVRMIPTDGTLDPYVILTNVAGYELASHDDISPSRTEAGIAHFTLPDDGLYLIRATRYGFQHGLTSGSYRLELRAESFGSSRDGVGLPALSYGESAQGRLSLERPIAHYAFNGRAGEQVSVTVLRQSGDLAPRLALLDPEGRPLAVSLQGFAEDEVRLTRVLLPADGLYTLDVRLGDLNTAGDYQLVLVGGERPPLEPGAFTPSPDLDVELVLLWASEADLELALSTSDGAAVGARTASANDLCQATTTTPVERITLAEGQAQSGLYRVTIRYRFDCTGEGASVDYLLGVAVHGQVVDVIGGVLPREGDTLQTWVLVP